MKVYIITGILLDFEGYGPEEVRQVIENDSAYCLNVEKVEEFEIGDWHDDHPLNQKGTDSITWLRSHRTSK